MIWLAAKHELRSNIISFRFLVGLALCLTLITASTFVLTMDYTIRLKNYSERITTRAESLKDVKVYSQVRSGADRPPSPLSFICVGSDRELGNTIEDISYREIPRSTVGQASGNPLVSAFSLFDTVVIVQIVLGLLALLLSHNTISGEREMGTLAMMLSNSVPRYHILMGKFLGGIISIAIPLTAGMVTGLLVVMNFDSVVLDSAAWGRIGMVFLSSLLYLSAIFALGILVSTRTVRSATSLVILMFIWVISVILLPNVSPHLARHLRKTENKAAVDAKREALEAEYWGKVGDFTNAQKRAGKFNFQMFFRFMAKYSPFAGDSPYPDVVYYAPRENMIWYMEGLRYCVPLHIEYADRIWELYRSYEEGLRRQRTLSDNVSRISPAWVYYNATSILAGTDSDAYMRFMEQTRRYRQQLIEYTEERRGFSTLSFFTTMKMEETLTYDQLVLMQESRGTEAVNRLKTHYWDEAPILKGIPVFHYHQEPIAESIVRAFPDLLILFILSLIFLLAAHASFLRRDMK